MYMFNDIQYYIVWRVLIYTQIRPSPTITSAFLKNRKVDWDGKMEHIIYNGLSFNKLVLNLKSNTYIS